MTTLDNIILKLKVEPDKTSIRDALALIKSLQENIDKLNKSSTNYLVTLNKMQRVQRATTIAMKQSVASMKSSSKELDTFAAKMGKANKETKSASVGGISAIGAAAGVAVGALTVLAGTVSVAATKYAEFQSELTLTSSLLQASAEETAVLEEAALKLGSTTAFTATEVAKLQGELAKKGFDVTQITAATEPILNLATAFKLDLSNAADIAGGAVKAFGLQASDTGRVVDVIGKLAGSSGAGVTDFGEAIADLGAIAQINNVPLEKQAALYGVLADNQIKGSAAGTVTKNLLGEIFNETGKVAKATGIYAKTADDIVPVLQALNKEQLSFTELQQLFGKESAAGIGLLIQNADAVDGLSNSLISAEGFTNSLAEAQKQTLGGALTSAKSAIDGLLIRGFKPLENIAVKLINTFSDLVNEFTEWVSALEYSTDTADVFIELFGGLIDGFILAYDFLSPLIVSLFDFNVALFRVVNAVREWVGAVYDAEQGSGILSGAVEFLNVVMEGLTGFIDDVTEGLEWLVGWFDNSAEAIRKTGDAAEVAKGKLKGLGDVDTTSTSKLVTETDKLIKKELERLKAKKDITLAADDEAKASKEAIEAGIKALQDRQAIVTDLLFDEDKIRKNVRAANKELLDEAVKADAKASTDIFKSFFNVAKATQKIEKEIADERERLNKESLALISDLAAASRRLAASDEERFGLAKDAVAAEEQLEAIARAKVIIGDEFAEVIRDTAKARKEEGFAAEDTRNLLFELIDAEKKRIEAEGGITGIEAREEAARKEAEAVKAAAEAYARYKTAAKDALSAIDKERTLATIELDKQIAKEEISTRDAELAKLNIITEFENKKLELINTKYAKLAENEDEFKLIKAKTELEILETTKAYYDTLAKFEAEDLEAKRKKAEDEKQLRKEIVDFTISETERLRAAVDRQGALIDLGEDIELARLKTLFLEGTILREEYEEGIRIIQNNANKARVKNLEDELVKLEQLGKEQLNALKIQLDAGDINYDTYLDEVDKVNKAIQTEAGLLELFLSKIRQKAAEDTAKIEEEQLKRRIEVFKASASAASDIISSLTDLNAARLDEVNRLLDNQANRVNQAIELAKLGNTEIVEEELKRQRKLEAMQKKAAERARRYAALQQALNSAVSLSNSIVAITKTAAESGVASPVTIPLVIGAIGGGIGLITSLVSGFFKDGVIDFQGKGNGTSDSNLVAISHGESVITAKGTRNAPKLLEAINNGDITDNYGSITSVVDGYPTNNISIDNSELVEKMDMQERLLKGMLDEISSLEKRFSFSANGMEEFVSTRQGKLRKLTNRLN